MVAEKNAESSNVTNLWCKTTLVLLVLGPSHFQTESGAQGGGGGGRAATRMSARLSQLQQLAATIVPQLRQQQLARTQQRLNRKSLRDADDR